MIFLVEPINYVKSFGPSGPCGSLDACDCDGADSCPAQYW